MQLYTNEGLASIAMAFFLLTHTRTHSKLWLGLAGAGQRARTFLGWLHFRSIGVLRMAGGFLRLVQIHIDGTQHHSAQEHRAVCVWETEANKKSGWHRTELKI